MMIIKRITENSEIIDPKEDTIFQNVSKSG